MLTFHRLTLQDSRAEADDALRLTFEVPDSLHEAFRCAPGQHVVLRAGDIRRTYSVITGPPLAATLTFCIRLQPRGAMSGVLKALTPGDTIEAMPPNGSFTYPATLELPIAESADAHYVALAAGVGITPILSIARAVLESPSSRFTLVFGNRQTGRMMLKDELLALKDQHMDRFSLHLVMSRGTEEIALRRGRIDAEKLATLSTFAFVTSDVAGFYLCGPGDFNRTLKSSLVSLGAAPSNIHTEYYSVEDSAEGAIDDASDARSTPSTHRTQDTTTHTGTITAIMDGREVHFDLDDDGSTILDAGLAAGIELPYSCCAGVCSTCRARLIEGEVDMLENFSLEEWELEQGFILACQARPRGDRVVISYDER